MRHAVEKKLTRLYEEMKADRPKRLAQVAAFDDAPGYTPRSCFGARRRRALGTLSSHPCVRESQRQTRQRAKQQGILELSLHIHGHLYLQYLTATPNVEKRDGIPGSLKISGMI